MRFRRHVWSSTTLLIRLSTVHNPEIIDIVGVLVGLQAVIVASIAGNIRAGGVVGGNRETLHDELVSLVQVDGGHVPPDGLVFFGVLELEDRDLVLGGGELNGDTAVVGVVLPGLSGKRRPQSLHVVCKVRGSPHVDGLTEIVLDLDTGAVGSSGGLDHVGGRDGRESSRGDPNSGSKVIRDARRIDRDRENSDHIQLLHSFGSSLEVDESDYPICDLSFGLEMARPELKGGVLIVLERPHSGQENQNGFMEGKNTCRTINAVSDLISAVNNAKLGFEDVSLFDAIPFLDETVAGNDHRDIIDEAQNVFADMTRAKDPNIILCCFKTESQTSFVKKLQSRGVGRSFYPNNPKLTEFSLSSILVNTFHPSYAINHYPISSCFKQLLILEFTKAFTL
ncbi:hypothetical protein N7456_003540 [Penicillium angulare]|uniref:Uncharacterized protein n=1 Tax=Penicillium angulare TaxID=116970 RepID=A0A9W9FVL0_9EURO|nr:hypothetical protein N7456_003540 [Penicillium angulare]